MVRLNTVTDSLVLLRVKIWSALLLFFARTITISILSACESLLPGECVNGILCSSLTIGEICHVDCRLTFTFLWIAFKILHDLFWISRLIYKDFPNSFKISHASFRISLPLCHQWCHLSHLSLIILGICPLVCESLRVVYSSSCPKYLTFPHTVSVSPGFLPSSIEDLTGKMITKQQHNIIAVTIKIVFIKPLLLSDVIVY